MCLTFTYSYRPISECLRPIPVSFTPPQGVSGKPAEKYGFVNHNRSHLKLLCDCFRAFKITCNHACEQSIGTAVSFQYGILIGLKSCHRNHWSECFVIINFCIFDITAAYQSRNQPTRVFTENSPCVDFGTPFLGPPLNDLSKRAFVYPSKFDQAQPLAVRSAAFSQAFHEMVFRCCDERSTVRRKRRLDQNLYTHPRLLQKLHSQDQRLAKRSWRPLPPSSRVTGVR